MKMWKRTFVSIFRKPAQSILMFLIVFILGNVLFASIAIKQTSENVRLEMRARVSSTVTLRLTNRHATETQFERMDTIIDELETNENVKSYSKFEIAEIKSFEKESINSPNYEPDYPYSTEYYNFSLIKNVDDSFYDYNMLEGRFYTQEELDNGARVVVLSDTDRYKYFYDEDGNFVISKLEVGDKLKIQLYNYKIVEEETNYGFKTYVEPDLDNLIEYEMEIIGIYSTMKYKPEYSDFKNVDTYIYSELPYKCFEEMQMLQNEAFNNHTEYDINMYKLNVFDNCEVFSYVERVQIKTNGLDAAEALEKQLLENQYFPKSYYAIESANEDYRYIQAPLENLDALANVALWSSVALIVVLLNLVSILFIRNRTKEIGILISMGERKLKLLGQFVSEILLVGLLATSCSMVTGIYFGDVVSQKFMEIQIDADYEAQYQEENPDDITQLDLLDTYKVELDGQYIASIYGVSALILMLSSALPMVYILKMKPKKILL